MYEVIYEFNTDIDPQKSASAPPQMKKMASDVDKILAESQSVLLCNRTYSINYVNSSSTTLGMSEVVAKSLMRFENTYFVDILGQRSIIKQNKSGEISTFIKDDKVVWEIIGESILINNIKCTMAKGTIITPGFNNEVVTVWFTKDYPFSIGPHGLYGLPGLIVKYKSTSIVMTVKSIKNIEKQKKAIDFPTAENLKKYSENLSNQKKHVPKKG
ncbi:MAG: GLPGLI family protein [Saprospiraceae bacterium]|nr:GLPGLI family protein [Saprospiraceae bacterium]